MAAKFPKGTLSDYGMTLAVVVVVLMLIIPLPAILLDLFMSVNILLSLLILLIAFTTPRAIDFPSFPTLLLVFTLFGIGINVSSTRLILSQGTSFRGQMVQAFATFVTGAQGGQGLGIGFVIFIILIAVQAMVINKGATRVAEVQARFFLDGMGPKKMAIQSDFSSGAISEDEAKRRNADLEKENALFGAMDGASKFVSGNVKLGILITVVNLIAGLAFGMILRGESFTVAIRTYARLTIGDGLISQLPALLMSVATGILLVRPASENSFAADVLRDSTQNEVVYFVAAGTFILLGFLPNFPWYIMWPLGGLLLFLALRLRRSHKIGLDEETAKALGSKKAEAASDIGAVAPPDPLSLELGYALIPLVDKENGAELLERIKRIRSEAGFDLGLPVPKIRIIDNMQLEPNQYSFKIRGIEAGKSTLRMGHLMCINTGNATEELEGEATRDPAFDLPALWIREDDREKAFRAGYEVVDPPTIIATHITAIIKSHAAEIIGRQEVQQIIDRLQKDYPVVAAEIGKIGLGTVQKVLQGLLREQVSIRNTVAIFETMSDYTEVTKVPWVLVEKVRQTLGRQICLQYADAEKTLRVFTVEPEFLAKLLESKADTTEGPVSALNPVLHHSWIVAVSAKAAELKERSLVPVILCPEEVRKVVKSSTEREMPSLVVLSIPEIPNDVKIESLGEVHVG